jgi:hypothetical protein
MRAREFLNNIINETSRSLSSLKTKVKAGIDKTNDETLLNRIYTTLNSGTLIGRLTGNLEKLSDPEIKAFLNEIAQTIINAPGSFEQKLAFVDGLHQGYVDINKMLDGKKHHFSDLLKPTKNVPLKFLFEIFNEMKDLGAKAKKGPGEFALAILSPKISVFGSGDLKIGKQIVEVKAGSGTIGDTSLFQHSKVHIILKEFFGDLIDISRPVGAEQLSTTIKRANLEPAKLTEFANKLADYIFKGQPWANTKPLKDAIQNSESATQVSDIRKGYLVAAYTAYKRKKDQQEDKFKGVMLVNYDNQELRYFEDPEEMYTDIDTVTFSLSHPNQGWGGKLISPSVNLRRDPIPKPELAAGTKNAALRGFSGQMAEYMIKQAQQRWPRNLELRDRGLVDVVAGTINDLMDAGINPKKLAAEVRRQYPELSLRAPSEPQEPVERSEPANPPRLKKTVQSAPEPAPTA